MKLSELVKMVRESAGVDDPVVTLNVESDEGDLIETCEISATLDLPTGAINLEGVMPEGIEPCEDCGAIDDGDGNCKCPPCESTNHKKHKGGIWQCKQCKRWFCYEEGADDDKVALCDDCAAGKVVVKESNHTNSCHKIVCDGSCKKKKGGKKVACMNCGSLQKERDIEYLGDSQWSCPNCKGEYVYCSNCDDNTPTDKMGVCAICKHDR